MKKFKPELPKRRNLLSEAYAWERQAGKALPTLAEVQAAYDARMQEDVDPEEEGHVYEEPPYDEDEDDMFESKAAKDYDGDGEIESGSEEYLGSRDKAIKAAADSTPDGNYVNKARAKSHLNKKDCSVYGHDASNKATKLNSTSDVDNPKYKKFTIKTESLAEAFKKRMMGNLKGSEYILSETFKRK
jgi:hypothetical protein